MRKQTIQKQIKEFETSIKSAKTMGQIDNYGLTGNNGLGVGGNFHVSMPYDSNGKVFVITKLKEKLPSGKFYTYESWKRIDKKKAKEKDIIRCTFCEKPAVRLDHLWPYHSEMNACEDHLNKIKEYLNKKELPKK